MEEFLFDKGSQNPPSPGEVAAEAKTGTSTGGKPRLRLPHRDQVEIRWLSLDQLPEPEHQARMGTAAAKTIYRLRCQTAAVSAAAKVTHAQ